MTPQLDGIKDELLRNHKYTSMEKGKKGRKVIEPHSNASENISKVVTSYSSGDELFRK